MGFSHSSISPTPPRSLSAASHDAPAIQPLSHSSISPTPPCSLSAASHDAPAVRPASGNRKDGELQRRQHASPQPRVDSPLPSAGLSPEPDAADGAPSSQSSAAFSALSDIVGDERSEADDTPRRASSTAARSARHAADHPASTGRHAAAAAPEQRPATAERSGSARPLQRRREIGPASSRRSPADADKAAAGAQRSKERSAAPRSAGTGRTGQNGHSYTGHDYIGRTGHNGRSPSEGSSDADVQRTLDFRSDDPADLCELSAVDLLSSNLSDGETDWLPFVLSSSSNAASNRSPRALRRTPRKPAGAPGGLISTDAATKVNSAKPRGGAPTSKSKRPPNPSTGRAQTIRGQGTAALR